MTRTVGTRRNAAERYLASTPKSQRLYERAVKSLPGGNTRTTIFFEPYPFYVARGEGCRVYDVDGNVRIDFINNYTSLILGHAHPKVVEAAMQQVKQGTSFACPSEREIELAEIIKERLPSVDLIRFTNSGTEATLMAIRAARAFTGRPKIAKFEGGYHGTHDSVVVSIKPPLDRAGPAESPLGVPDSPGIPVSVVENTVILPFNDPDATVRLVEHHRDELAAIIVEPVIGAGGILPPQPGFLQLLRDLTERLGILLIFDEVISFRLSYHGAQGRFGVKPDLTTLGKIIGGGFPVGAFGGRADVMSRFDPRRTSDKIDHGGTFNANPVTLAAGVATLMEMTPAHYTQLETLTDELRDKLLDLFQTRRVPATVTQAGSLFNIHFTSSEVTNHRAVRRTDLELLHRVHLSLLNNGIYLTARGMGCLSTPMTSTEVNAFVKAMDIALDEALAN